MDLSDEPVWAAIEKEDLDEEEIVKMMGGCGIGKEVKQEKTEKVETKKVGETKENEGKQTENKKDETIKEDATKKQYANSTGAQLQKSAGINLPDTVASFAGFKKPITERVQERTREASQLSRAQSATNADVTTSNVDDDKDTKSKEEVKASSSPSSRRRSVRFNLEDDTEFANANNDEAHEVIPTSSTQAGAQSASLDELEEDVEEEDPKNLLGEEKCKSEKSEKKNPENPEEKQDADAVSLFEYDRTPLDRSSLKKDFINGQSLGLKIVMYLTSWITEKTREVIARRNREGIEDRFAPKVEGPSPVADNGGSSGNTGTYRQGCLDELDDVDDIDLGSSNSKNNPTNSDDPESRPPPVSTTNCLSRLDTADAGGLQTSKGTLLIGHWTRSESELSPSQIRWLRNELIPSLFLEDINMGIPDISAFEGRLMKFLCWAFVGEDAKGDSSNGVNSRCIEIYEECEIPGFYRQQIEEALGIVVCREIVQGGA